MKWTVSLAFAGGHFMVLWGFVWVCMYGFIYTLITFKSKQHLLTIERYSSKQSPPLLNTINKVNVEARHKALLSKGEMFQHTPRITRVSDKPSDDTLSLLMVTLKV